MKNYYKFIPAKFNMKKEHKIVFNFTGIPAEEILFFLIELFQTLNFRTFASIEESIKKVLNEEETNLYVYYSYITNEIMGSNNDDRVISEDTRKLHIICLNNTYKKEKIKKIFQSMIINIIENR